MASFLPNEPVHNDQMEEYLGFIAGEKSRFKNIILRNNGIKTRYYAIDKNGNSTHSNAQLTKCAIEKLFDNTFTAEDIQLLACGTSSSEHIVPAHASMVQGELQCNPVEVMSPCGTCNSGMLALKYGYMSVLSGLTDNAVCTGSEKNSIWMRADNFVEEANRLCELGKNPYIAFEREFLRWMLSDGAGAFLLQNIPNSLGISLRIDWMEIISYANELNTCMFAGGLRTEDGNVKPWREMNQHEQMTNSVFSLQQDAKLLEKFITRKGAEFLADISKKHNFLPAQMDYFLPHMSSEFFRKKIEEDAKALNVPIPYDKWFTNLDRVGNLGAASAYVMLEELFNSGKLQKGKTILVMVPESARFSYTFMKLTVV